MSLEILTSVDNFQEAVDMKTFAHESNTNKNDWRRDESPYFLLKDEDAILSLCTYKPSTS